MIVTYRDELGVVSVEIDGKRGVTFGLTKAFFTDEENNDYVVNFEHLISIEEKEKQQL